MPKETFNNLQPDKRERLLSIALEEFGANPYKNASVNRIVRAADIAKGSLYQYFDNKKGLYRYLIEIAAQAKFRYISEHIPAEAEDFFAILKEMLYAGAMFDIHCPKYSRLLLNVTYENYDPEVKDIADNLRSLSHEYIRKCVFSGQVREQVRRDADTDLLVFILHTLVDLDSYFKSVYHFSLKELVHAGITEYPIGEEELKRLADQVVDILANGLNPPPVNF